MGVTLRKIGPLVCIYASVRHSPAARNTPSGTCKRTHQHLSLRLYRRAAAVYSYVFYFCDLVTGWLTYFPEPPTTAGRRIRSCIHIIYRRRLAFSHPAHNKLNRNGRRSRFARRLSPASAQINENHTAINHALVCC
jgi:hypothetical protein